MPDAQSYQEAAKPRSSMPRTFKVPKKRVREGNTKSHKRVGMEEMESLKRLENESNSAWNLHTDRTTLCLPSFQDGSILHAGDAGFNDLLKAYFPVAESNATDKLVDLKRRLRLASAKDFWTILLEEMCAITGSQCGFVAKRILVNDQDSAVEMPELGEPGSCLMGVGFYINNGQDVKEMYHDYRWHAYGTPCAHMKHDKVFIVPERLKEVVPDNPNPMPWKQSEAFIGVPLFAEGKCFAHFGMVWSSEGASQRQLGWNYIEMFMHSLEDMIVQRILEGQGFQKGVEKPDSAAAKVIPLAAITASQSLRPYARSLSHELRTPMQGVVGMLDIMYATVLEAIFTQPNGRDLSVFEDLQHHIEVAQESSKRAVEAADNVVHAYDINLEMPDAPITPEETDSGSSKSFFPESNSGKRTPERNNELQPPMSSKRARPDITLNDGPPHKKPFAVKEADLFTILCLDETATCTTATMSNPNMDTRKEEKDGSRSPVSNPAFTNPLHRRVVIREFLRNLLSDTLRSGHSVQEIHTETELGEKIEVKTVGSRGEIQERTLYLEVEPDVPGVIITEQQHLQFSLQKIIDNAIKFTESGSIYVKVRLGKMDEKIEVWVVDTGCGIDEDSKQYLFKPHFQQDSGISRARDGLGLSLFNAKAHIRKNLGGDVTLERSDTEGPSKGSEFLIRLPMSSMDSENNTPIVGTPPPSSQQSNRAFWTDPYTSPGAQRQLNSGDRSPLLGAVSALSCSSSRPNPLTALTQRRPAFNPNLAKDYPLNILIAEDNAINRNVAIGSLSKLGYSDTNITVAFDGEEAVQHYKTSLSKPPQERFNAILMDIWMPKMDGYEATKKIKEIAESVGERIATIAVTADITHESVERAKAVGMEGFLAKPYKVLDIERLIIGHFVKRTEEAS